MSLQRIVTTAGGFVPKSGDLQKRQLNIRLTGLARGLLVKLAQAKGVSQTDILEMMIREEAERVGLVTNVKGTLKPT